MVPVVLWLGEVTIAPSNETKRPMHIFPVITPPRHGFAVRSGRQYPAHRFYERPYVSISDVRYALESPWPCDELELGPSSRRRCLLSFLRAENPTCATKPYLGSKINRAAGRVIKNPLVSVTIDVLMMRIPSCRANGSDREKWRRWEGR